MIVEHRRFTTVDLAALARDAEAAGGWRPSMRRPRRSTSGWARGRSFCPGLAHVPYHATRYVGGS
jgi:hypothetical protein